MWRRDTVVRQLYGVSPTELRRSPLLLARLNLAAYYAILTVTYTT
jgi:hypothetical protein